MSTHTSRTVKRSRSTEVSVRRSFTDTSLQSRGNRSFTGAYAVHRSSSTSDLAAGFNRDASYVSEKYKPTHYRRYHRDWDLFDDYWWDRRYHTSPLFWPTHCWPNRTKYYYNDPYYTLWWNYPSLSHYPKYQRLTYMDRMDPLSWTRYRNPYYDNALCYPYKPWTMECGDTKRTSQMYKQGLINFETVERNWLVPSHFQRNYNDMSHPHKAPTWYTSPRRYAFTFDTM